MSLSRESEKCFNRGENRTRDLGVTSPQAFFAFPAERHITLEHNHITYLQREQIHHIIYIYIYI